MAAIISDKFRIFNAQQFLESLSEGANDAASERTLMYFFVGRPQGWNSFLEIYSKNAVAFAGGGGTFAYVSQDDNGTYNIATSPWSARIEEVYDNSLVLSNVGAGGGSALSTPLPGARIEGWSGSDPTNAATGADTGAEAFAGVYRYATEDAPPGPLDHQLEKFAVYDEIIAAKRIKSEFARAVVTRYDWNPLATEKRFDMYKPDYTETTTGQVGKGSFTSATELGAAKFYLINGKYEVFKCLYNGEFPGRTLPDPQYQPDTSPGAGAGTFSNGIFTDGASAVVSATSGYVWKYMYTMPTNDVIRFLSTNFLPINEATESTRAATAGAAVDGAIDIVLVEAVGSGLPNGTHYAPINGDGQLAGGTEAVVKIVVDSGAIESTEVVVKGAGYTYGEVRLVDGATVGGIKTGLYSDQGLTSARSGVSGVGALEVVIGPEGGHGSADMEAELNAKRVMTNIRLTYAEGAGDFPVDNDFRRIGIIKDPTEWGSSINKMTEDTASGLYVLRINGATADYTSDETITQALAGGGTAKGTVVSWVLDEGSTTNGTLKYLQTPEFHKDQGIVRAFDASAPVVGSNSLASGTVTTGDTGTFLGVPVTSGQGNPQIEPNSGDIIYIENRRLITRAPDQIEDIKLVIEF
jgi:hypothetical protein